VRRSLPISHRLLTDVSSLLRRGRRTWESASLVADAEVIEAIRDLVERGEYRDEIPGVPGARLTGGGVFRDDRRLYSRGSQEYLEARAAGLTERLPPLTTASRAAVQEAESVIGSALPDLSLRLRDLLLCRLFVA
jgi:hypothetical protein